MVLCRSRRITARNADRMYTSPDVAALGELAPYCAPGVTDLLIDGAGQLWVDGGDGLGPRHDWRPLGEPMVRRLAVRLIAQGGRHLDEATPCVDVRLAGGIRVHAVLPPVSTAGTLLSIRLPASEPLGLAELVHRGSLSAELAGQLVDAVHARRNVLITGATGSGKTTLLSALLAEVPSEQRILTIEDVAELQVAHPHVVGLEARQPNLEGRGGVDLAQLLRQALRMRPDRIVLGECRGAELRELLAALNTGHAGSAGTMHVNRLEDVPARLLALGAVAGLNAEALGMQAAAAFDLLIHSARGRDGRRRVDQVARLRWARGELHVEQGFQ